MIYIFKTKLEKEIAVRKYSPEYIKLNAMSGMKFLPDEGEMFSISGGLGNGVIKQLKKEDGVYYERNSIKDEWSKFDLGVMYERMMNIISL